MIKPTYYFWFIYYKSLYKYGKLAISIYIYDKTKCTVTWIFLWTQKLPHLVDLHNNQPMWMDSPNQAMWITSKYSIQQWYHIIGVTTLIHIDIVLVSRMFALKLGLTCATIVTSYWFSCYHVDKITITTNIFSSWFPFSISPIGFSCHYCSPFAYLPLSFK